ncbi:MAG TPA: hypothetical protein VK066_01780 [Chloroflexota bacterium]|nr:hypothetical protein [Chloroflexota bacterium]
MDRLDQIGGILLFFGAGLWVAWLLGGTLINRRRAAAVSRWAYAEARPLGKKLYVRWITMAAFELTVPEARAPFRQLSFTGFLQSREMPFVWLWNRLRRRGDVLVVRAELRRRPLWGLEVYRAQSLLGGDARRAALEAGWTPAPGPDGLWRANGGGAAAELSERLVGALGPWAAHLDRLAVRRETPQLVLALGLSGVRPGAAPPLGACLTRLAQLASAG